MNSIQTSNDVGQTSSDPQVDNFEYVEEILNREQQCVDSGGNSRQYYCYKLQIRDDQTILLHFGRL